MVNVFEKEYKYSEIFEILRNKNAEDFEKISAIISIDFIEKQEDFNILIYHLTNHSTPIREAVSIKLEEISNKEIDLFLNKEAKNQIIKAIIDINPNVSRAICSIIEKNNKLQDFIREDLFIKTGELIEDIKKYQEENNDFCEQKNKKSHAKNKKLFAFYWYLEAISSCFDEKNNSQVLEIIEFAINFHDYTIREKSAKILAKMKKPPLELLQKAKSDQNFYVKNLVYDKIYYEID